MSIPALRRVVRRETHSPRTAAMFVAAVLLILALVYIGVEIVLSLLAQPALAFEPAASLGWIVGLPTARPQGLVLAGGVATAVVGLVCVYLAVAPGRLSKHELTWGERAVVVDNGVIASSLAQHLSNETGLPRDRITVGVAHRRVDVAIRPGAGVPLNEQRVRELAEAEVTSYELTPRVSIRLRVERPEESELAG